MVENAYSHERTYTLQSKWSIPAQSRVHTFHVLTKQLFVLYAADAAAEGVLRFRPSSTQQLTEGGKALILG